MVDGVDDFFVRFRSELGDRAIQELVRAFSRQFPLCDVVFGIRSSMLNSAIPRFRGRTVEVACFSDAEVEKRIDAEKLPPELAAALKERARQRDGVEVFCGPRWYCYRYCAGPQGKRIVRSVSAANRNAS
jgi:hypothetical protein